MKIQNRRPNVKTKTPWHFDSALWPRMPTNCTTVRLNRLYQRHAITDKSHVELPGSSCRRHFLLTTSSIIIIIKLELSARWILTKHCALEFGSCDPSILVDITRHSKKEQDKTQAISTVLWVALDDWLASLEWPAKKTQFQYHRTRNKATNSYILQTASKVR